VSQATPRFSVRLKQFGDQGETGLRQQNQTTILVVNDLPDQLKIMTLQLRRAGYNVLTAGDGLQGLAVAEREHPDLIISDVSMPRMDGIEMCRHIRQHPDLQLTPVLLVSAIRKDSDSVVEGLRVGADDYLEVPYDSMSLIAKIVRLLEKRQAEKALKQSEERFRALIEQASDIVSILAKDGTIRYQSPSITRILGYQPEELVGKNTFDFFHPDDLPALLERFTQMFEHGGSRQTIECRFRHKDGSWRAFESIGKTFVDESGELVAMVNSRDISERRRADRAIKFQAHLLDTVEQAVIATDLDGKITYWNRFAEKLYGWSREEALGRQIIEVASAQQTREQAAEIMRQLQKGNGWSGEFLVQRRDGTTFPAMVTTSPIYDESGRLIGMLGISFDITERKQAEARLVYQANLLANVHDAIIACDDQLNITAWNRAAEVLYGWTAEEAMGRQARDLLRGEFTDDQRAEALKRLAETGHHQAEMVHYRQDGTRLYIQAYTITLRDEAGRITGYVSANRDITKRKQAEEKLRLSESQLAESQRLAHVGSWNWDLQTNTLTWSEEHYRIFSLDPQEYNPTYDSSVTEYIHPEDQDMLRNVIETALRTGEPFEAYGRIVRPDGEVRVIHSRGSIISDAQGTPLRMFGTAQDVTERRLAEEQLNSSNEKLRALSARLQAVREEESLRIAREIHDEMGGALTGLKIDISWLDRRLPKDGYQLLHQRLQSMAQLIDETIQKVRQISTELRPSVLDDLGLAAAIEWQAREFQRRTGIKCTITALAEDVALGPEKATAVFRIFQEILINIARHAGATFVEIAMQELDGSLILKVSDNGRGITERESSHNKSLGLLGMRERALVFGGTVEITGVEGKGTTVTVIIPHE
jgi:PAS domain S-box-containing protein